MPGMAIPLRRMLRQSLVYWQKVGPDAFGKPAFLSTTDNPPIPIGVQLSCRWEDRQQEIIMADGRKVLSKGFLIMTSPLVVGSMVMLGSLVTWQSMPTYPAVPTVLQGGREVLVARLIPDMWSGLKNLSNVYENYL